MPRHRLIQANTELCSFDDTYYNGPPRDLSASYLTVELLSSRALCRNASVLLEANGWRLQRTIAPTHARRAGQLAELGMFQKAWGAFRWAFGWLTYRRADLFAKTGLGDDDVLAMMYWRCCIGDLGKGSDGYKSRGRGAVKASLIPELKTHSASERLNTIFGS